MLSTLTTGKSTWYFPGGKRENEESDTACLQREIREELSVELLPDTLKLYGVFEAQAHGHTPGIPIKMACYFADYTGTLQASSEIGRFSWLSTADAAESSAVDQLIFETLKKDGLIR